MSMSSGTGSAYVAATVTIPSPTNLHEISATANSLTIAWTLSQLAESAEGTIVELASSPYMLTAFEIVDADGETYSLSNTHHILINGNVDPRTGSATVDLLLYKNHLVYQQNSAGTWYYTADAADSWHLASSPLVTHFGVIAELISLKNSLKNQTQITRINQIISDVGHLMP